MIRTEQKPEHFMINKSGRGFFLLIFPLLFMIGCSTWSIPKSIVPSLKSSRAPLDYKKDKNDSETIFSVGTRISSLEVSEDSRFVVANYLKEKISGPDKENHFLFNFKTELWNIENRIPCKEMEEDLNDLHWVDSSSFDRNGKNVLISTRASQKGSAQVYRLNLEEKTFNSLLSDPFPYKKIRLFKGDHWIACEDQKNYWHLISRKDLNRKVFFPAIEIAEEEDGSISKKEYLVAEVLAISRNGDLVATLLTPSDNFSQKDPLDENTPTNRKRIVVIWDLKVVGSILLNNARFPLEAIKISHFKVEDGIEPRKCEFSSQGDIIAIRSKSRYVGLWETANGKLISELGEHKQRIQALAFAPNNLKLVVATGGERGRLILWDIRKESVHRTYEDPDPACKRITAVAYASDGRSIYYGTDGGDVKVLDLRQPLIK